MSPDWYRDAVFYHIYPLGYAGAPMKNDFKSDPVPRLNAVEDQISHITGLGCNAVYFGPIFESSSHGYDTASYSCVDRRLGDEESFRRIVDRMHEAGIKVVLDGVFNHVGRDFRAFRDVLDRRSESAYLGWFAGLDLGGENVFGDGLSYLGWEGNEDLVTLDLTNRSVRNHIFESVAWMMDSLGIDGLRLDVAYLLKDEFITDLTSFCRTRRSDFWLMGEIIHGDYRSIVRSDGLDSATNYECYKGLYSSHNDGNFFEIAWSLERQFGSEGIYRNACLYNFLDNHDVNRIASLLDEENHLFTAYALMFTIPGIPSVYYGSEWRAQGVRNTAGDAALRPGLSDIPQNDDALVRQVRILSELRRKYPALRRGSYRQILVDHRHIVFERRTEEQTILVAVNSSKEEACLSFDPGGEAVNVLDREETMITGDVLKIPPTGWKVLEVYNRD